MEGLEDSEVITCSSSTVNGSNLRINIINANLYDSGDISQPENCSLKNERFGIIKSVTDELQNICSTSSNCSISKSFLVNLLSDSQIIQCLSSTIFYNCVSPSSEILQLTAYNSLITNSILFFKRLRRTIRIHLIVSGLVSNANKHFV